MNNVHPINGYISFNAAQKPKYGAFKSMREGQINIVGKCPFPTMAGGAALVALKQPFMGQWMLTHQWHTLFRHSPSHQTIR